MGEHIRIHTVHIIYAYMCMKQFPKISEKLLTVAVRKVNRGTDGGGYSLFFTVASFLQFEYFSLFILPFPKIFQLKSFKLSSILSGSCHTISLPALPPLVPYWDTESLRMQTFQKAPENPGKQITKLKTIQKKKENIHSPIGSNEVGPKDRAGFSCRGRESAPGTEVGQQAGTATAVTLAKDQWCS